MQNRRVDVIPALILVLACAGMASGQTTITSPTASQRVKAGADFATDVIANPWDQSDRADPALMAQTTYWAAWRSPAEHSTRHRCRRRRRGSAVQGPQSRFTTRCIRSTSQRRAVSDHHVAYTRLSFAEGERRRRSPTLLVSHHTTTRPTPAFQVATALREVREPTANDTTVSGVWKIHRHLPGARSRRSWDGAAVLGLRLG